MKRKVLFLLTAALVASGAWYVYHGERECDFAFAGEREFSKEDEVPEKYRDTIRKGLDYLAAQQHADGHWEGDDGKHPVAMTALAGLALVMEWEPPGRRLRDTATNGKNGKHVLKAVDWLLGKQQASRDGLFYAEHPSETSRYMEGHGLATVFLAGVYRSEEDAARRKVLRDALTQAVRYIAKAQSSQGGWYHTSRVEGHDFDSIAATAIQLQALMAAHNIGIPHSPGVVKDGLGYLKTSISKQFRANKEEIASALACCFEYGDLEQLSGEWFHQHQTKVPVGRDLQLGRDELLHYYYSQAVFNMTNQNKGSMNWQNYRTAMFDHLQSTQAKDGNWPPGNGIGVGPVYTTAMWCVVLQHGRNRHPSMPVIHEIVK